MSGLQLVFAVIGVASLLILFASVLFVELDVFDSDVASASEFPTPEWHDLDLRVLLPGAVAFGAVGYGALDLGFPGFAALLLAVAGYVGVGWLSFRFVLVPLARQQYNTLLSRESYNGLTARVTTPPDEKGYGVVVFTNANGALVHERAQFDKVLPSGSEVLIYSVKQHFVCVTSRPTLTAEI